MNLFNGTQSFPIVKCTAVQPVLVPNGGSIWFPAIARRRIESRVSAACDLDAHAGEAMLLAKC